jgi:Cation transporter/ATPase, N-terminus
MVSCVYSELLDPRAAVNCEGAHCTGFPASPYTAPAEHEIEPMAPQSPAAPMTSGPETAGPETDGEPRTDAHSGGLRASEAAMRLHRDGPNPLPQPDRRGWPRMVLDVLREPMPLLLAAATPVAVVVGRRSGPMPIHAQDLSHINIGAAHMACNISIGFGQAAFDRLLGACSNMFPDREQINDLSSRTPTQWVEGSAVVGTGHKQIHPPASPSFGMTCSSIRRF